MLIVGTGGLARDVITSWEIDKNNKDKTLYLFDNVNTETDYLYEKYKILHNYDQVATLFATQCKDFFVCIANPLLRKRVTETFEQLGGNLVPFVSCKVSVVSPHTLLTGGVILEPAVVISRNVTLEKGVFVNAGAMIGHDVVLREYVSLGPGVKVLGGVEVGEFSYIGTNSIIMPKVKIGKKVRIGVNLVIDQDVPDNAKITC